MVFSGSSAPKPWWFYINFWGLRDRRHMDLGFQLQFVSVPLEVPDVMPMGLLSNISEPIQASIADEPWTPHIRLGYPNIFSVPYLEAQFLVISGFLCNLCFFCGYIPTNVGKTIMNHPQFHHFDRWYVTIPKWMVYGIVSTTLMGTISLCLHPFFPARTLTRTSFCLLMPGRSRNPHT